MFNLLLAIRATHYGQIVRDVIIKEKTKNYKVIYLPAINQQKTATIKKFNYHHEITAYLNEKIKKKEKKKEKKKNYGRKKRSKRY